MSELRKAAQQALEALESCGAEAYNYELVLDAENALYAALAQPESDQGIKQAVESEREACAKVCDQRKIVTPEWQMDQHYNQAASHCAQAIRLRGRK